MLSITPSRCVQATSADVTATVTTTTVTVTVTMTPKPLRMASPPALLQAGGTSRWFWREMMVTSTSWSPRPSRYSTCSSHNPFSFIPAFAHANLAIIRSPSFSRLTTLSPECRGSGHRAVVGRMQRICCYVRVTSTACTYTVTERYLLLFPVSQIFPTL